MVRPAPESVTVFEPGGTPYACFRIPAIVRSGGDLLAFCEGRRDSAADSGPIDIVLRRSGDQGRTWDPLQVIATAADHTVGNPAPVAAADTVVLLSVQNPAALDEADILAGRGSRRVFVQTSGDNGRTFSAPRDITGSAKRPDWGWYATGPGHGIALADGRLLVPANHSVLPTNGKPATPNVYGGHCVISDDSGATWRIGFAQNDSGEQINPNETTAARLPNGRVYFNARNQQGSAPGTRVDAYSSDGGETLDGDYRPQPGIHTPMVQGSVLQSEAGALLYSGPTGSERRRMGIRASSDGGRTWIPVAEFEDSPAGYSDLVLVDRDQIGILYETGTASPYEAIRFRSLGLAELT
ncbi:MAG TPA: sialidase family protein [Mycobacteriales bacterium]|nr:sialidase family protein [Mycobacteriales bacterium]